jgi:ketosteroid isomerase-like protein
MKRKLLVLALSFVLASSAFAQRRGAGGMQGNQSAGKGQSTGMGNRGAGQQSQQQTQMQDRQRLRIHASDQQQQQSRTCTQSMDRVRTQLRTMSRISKNQAISSGQASQWREQLRNDIQTMNQEQTRLTNGLTPEQQDAVKNRTQQMQTTREQLQQMSEALEMELAMEAPDPVKVRQQAREMDTAMNKIRTQQQQFNNDLGIEE